MMRDKPSVGGSRETMMKMEKYTTLLLLLSDSGDRR